MSDPSTEDFVPETPQSPPATKEATTPAKKATKKTAKKSAKKATKKVAKKAAKKTTAKKTAKKAAKKSAKKATKKTASATVETVQEQMVFVEPSITPPKKPQSAPSTTPPSVTAPPVSSSPISSDLAPHPKQAPQPPAPSSSPQPTTQERQSDQPKPEPTQPSQAPASHQETPPTQPVMGRVKGLGPIRKSNQDNSESQPQEDRRNDNRRDHQRDNQRDNRRGKRRPNDSRNDSRNSNHRESDDNGNRDNRDNRQGKGRRNNNRNNRKNQQNRNNNPNQHPNQNPNQNRERPPKRPVVLTGDPVEVNGMLELAPKGFGFLRVPEKKFEQCQKDVFVPPDVIRTQGLRAGVWIHGLAQEGPRGLQLTKLETINDLPPEEAFKLPHFEELKAINPNRRISFETTPERFTTRILDIISPVGRGQRGLIVSPPRTGKTTLLLHMAEAIEEKYDESIHLIILLVDERPEEVTEFRRLLPNAEIYASSNDDPARNHARIAELCIERAKRLVEGNKDVLILMDSITRLARAYNNGSGTGGGKQKGKNRGYQSGGIVAGALEMPRRIFAAARNTRNAGSLTILATALIQTNSRADEVIFQEFKGTGNMELVLDRKIAEQYIYPAVDIFKSGTRREELIMADHLLQKINLIRRGLAGHRPEEAMERLLFFLKKFPNNTQMLMEIKG